MRWLIWCYKWLGWVEFNLELTDVVENKNIPKVNDVSISLCINDIMHINNK